MFGQRESSRGLTIDKQRNISNMGLFAIAEPQGFDVAEIRIFESRSIYSASMIRL